MLYNVLDSSVRRRISTCNFNQPINIPHPDRIMTEHDLVYIREGRWKISQDGTDYDLGAGDVILLQSRHHHYGIVACESVLKTCYVHFNSSEADRVCEATKMEKNEIVFPMVVHCADHPMVEHYFSQMILAFWSDTELSGAKASAYLDLCLYEISSCWRENTDKSSLVTEIKLLIQKSPQRFFSNQEIADRFGVSVRTICSKFKESTGSSLHAWQIEMKCRMADNLMQYNPQLTLKEIASIYGFYDEYHFGKHYKKLFGYSPIRKR